MSLTLLEKFELLASFKDPEDRYSPEYGIYLLRRWAHVELAAVVPREPHPASEYVPLPPSTVTAITVNPLESMEEYERRIAETGIGDDHVSFDYFRSIYPLLLRFDAGQFVDFEVALRAWAIEIPDHVQYLAAVRRERVARHRDQYEQLLQTARALGTGKISIGRSVERALTDAAAELERAIGWLDPFLVDSPSGGVARAELLLSLHLWAIEQIRNAVNDFRKIAVTLPWGGGPIPEPKLIERSTIIRELAAGWSELSDDAGNASSWTMRIRRLEDQIRVDERDVSAELPQMVPEPDDPRVHTKAKLLAATLTELRRLHDEA